MDRVSAEFNPGEIHAVLGENGAGKSTLMGVLAGFVVPDSGVVRFGEKPFPIGNPSEAKKRGVELVHQHFMLVPEFTVAENLALYRTGSLLGAGKVQALAAPALELGRTLGWELDPHARTGDLPVGVQQRVEILKALSGNAPAILFDEPTAVLSPDEVEDLFRVLRSLKDAGKIIILIAHKLSEVMGVADRVTVLRRGKWVAAAPMAGLTAATLADWMVGEMPEPTAKPPTEFGEVVISAKTLKVLGDRKELAIRDIDFEIRSGEILGFGGVDGNGQVELAEALAGVRSAEGLAQNPLSISGWGGGRGWGAEANAPAKIAYIPQDRQHDGLALELSIFDNLSIGGYTRFKRGPFIEVRALRAWAETIVEKYQIKIGHLKDPVRSLSGGNQQKVVVGRSLDQKPDIVVAVNPTRGLDLKASEAVRSALIHCASEGAAIALISTDLDELAALAHRTVFLSRGHLTEEQSAEALTG